MHRQMWTGLALLSLAVVVPIQAGLVVTVPGTANIFDAGRLASPRGGGTLPPSVTFSDGSVPYFVFNNEAGDVTFWNRAPSYGPEGSFDPGDGTYVAGYSGRSIPGTHEPGCRARKLQLHDNLPRCPELQPPARTGLLHRGRAGNQSRCPAVLRAQRRDAAVLRFCRRKPWVWSCERASVAGSVWGQFGFAHICSGLPPHPETATTCRNSRTALLLTGRGRHRGFGAVSPASGLNLSHRTRTGLCPWHCDFRFPCGIPPHQSRRAA